MRDLRELDPSDGRYGGKSRGLAWLAASGANVPDGFATLPTTEPPITWPAEEATELARGLRALLAGGAIAIRSSAAAEDGAEHSYAGQFDSVLDVRTLGDAQDAIARVIASGRTARARDYAGVDAPIPMGSIAQRMIEPTVSGACFTTDPAGRHRGAVVEATAGRGDALMAGRVAPERWSVHLAAGGRWVALDERRSAGSVGALTAARAIEVARGGQDLARARGAPLDLEWAIDAAGTLWWLQARPITATATATLPDVDRTCPEADDGALAVWSDVNVRETMADPLPLLAWSYWRDVMAGPFAHAMFGRSARSRGFRQLVPLDRIDGRIHWNLNVLAHIPGFLALAERAFSAVDAHVGPALARAIADPAFTPRRLPCSRLGLSVSAALESARGLVLGALRPRHLRRALARTERDAGARSAEALAGAPRAELVRALTWTGWARGAPASHGLSAATLAGATWLVARALFAGHDEARDLLSVALPGNPTTAISRELARLARAGAPLRARIDAARTVDELARDLSADAAGTAWLARFRAFLATYGHRCPGEMDLARPRWHEAPEMVLGLVRAGMAEAQGEDALDRMARLARRRTSAIEAAFARMWLPRRVVARAALAFHERCAPWRDLPKHYLLHAFASARAAALELGRRLVRAGRTEDAQDAIHLGVAELADESRTPPAGEVLRRKAQLAAWAARPAPGIHRSDGVPAVPPPAVRPGEIGGFAGSPGTHTGPVRRLTVPDPTRVTRGDVLVLRHADPAWTPLFARAGALVMEVGGALCHAAVVARELGVPAVLGAVGAMDQLVDGQLVHVDGTRGLVREIDPAGTS